MGLFPEPLTRTVTELRSLFLGLPALRASRDSYPGKRADSSVGDLACLPSGSFSPPAVRLLTLSRIPVRLVEPLTTMQADKQGPEQEHVVIPNIGVLSVVLAECLDAKLRYLW